MDALLTRMINLRQFIHEGIALRCARYWDEALINVCRGVDGLNGVVLVQSPAGREE